MIYLSNVVIIRGYKSSIPKGHVPLGLAEAVDACDQVSFHLGRPNEEIWRRKVHISTITCIYFCTSSASTFSEDISTSYSIHLTKHHDKCHISCLYGGFHKIGVYPQSSSSC